jgi:hypothetical protein
MKYIIKIANFSMLFARQYPSLSFLLFALGIVALIIYVAVFFAEAEAIIFAMYLALALSSLLIESLTLMVFLHVVKRHS